MITLAFECWIQFGHGLDGRTLALVEWRDVSRVAQAELDLGNDVGHENGELRAAYCAIVRCGIQVGHLVYLVLDAL